MLTFEGSPIQGAATISAKLVVRVGGHSVTCAFLTDEQGLPFAKVQHKITTLDAQPSSPTVASLLVSVTGLLVVRPPSRDPSETDNYAQVDDSTNPLNFSQVFHLVPEGASYYVYGGFPSSDILLTSFAASTTSSV